MKELELSSQSDRVLFGRIAHALNITGAQIVSEEDYQQLLCPLDQLYIDYMWQGKLFTLHLEHTLGIFIFSGALDINVLNEIANKLRTAMEQ